MLNDPLTRERMAAAQDVINLLAQLLPFTVPGAALDAAFGAGGWHPGARCRTRVRATGITDEAHWWRFWPASWHRASGHAA